jgi:glutamate racemase
MDESSSHAIGVFDSGLGGLTVTKALQSQVPNESILYLGDTARVPYGSRCPDTIRRYVKECAEFFLDKPIKLLVVACNTASVYALDLFEDILPVPVIGVLTPGAEAVVHASKTGHIAILGTRATVASGAYPHMIQSMAPNAQVQSIACPLLVSLVEEQMQEHPATQMILQEYLQPCLENPKVDTILLACTHYPILHTLIQEIVGETIRVVDSAQTCAEAVQRLLVEEKQLKQASQRGDSLFYVTEGAEQFCRSAEDFLGYGINTAEHIQLTAKEQVLSSRY